MQDQTDFQSTGPQVVQRLTSSKRRKYRRGLQFHNNSRINDEIKPYCCQWFASIRNRNYQLSVHGVAARPEFTLQCERIDSLQKTEPESIIDLEERANDRGGRFPLEQTMSTHAEVLTASVTGPSSGAGIIRPHSRDPRPRC